MAEDILKTKIIYTGFGICLARVELDLTVEQCDTIANILGGLQGEALRAAAVRLDKHEVEQ